MNASVSVIICTRDNADSLRRAIDCLCRCEVPPELAVELVVVDNGSSDHTHAVVARTTSCRLKLKYVLEPRVGKGYAYNRGVQEASGDTLLFTDDDVFVAREWIVRMSEPILSGSAHYVSGRVLIAQHLRRPWMTLRQRSWLASTEIIEKLGLCMLVGASMGLSRRAIETCGSFDTNLGPGASGFGDETLVAKQLYAAALPFRFVDVDAEHHFDSSRLLRKSFEAMAVKQARSDGYILYHWHHECVCFRKIRELKKRIELRVSTAIAGLSAPSAESEGISERQMMLIYAFELYRFLGEVDGSPRLYSKRGRSVRSLSSFNPSGARIVSQ